MAWGVVAGLLAGAFWGLTFVAPLAVAPFTGFDLTFVRYASYGALSIPAVVALWRNGRLNRAMLLQAALLSAAGFVGYFVLMSIAVKLSGVAVVALIVGTLPLIIALLGNRGSGRIHGSRLVAPLFLIGAGLLIVNIDAVRHVMATAPDSLGRFALGVALIIVATALWAWYALANASGMKKHQDLSAAQWSALQGVGCHVRPFPSASTGAGMRAYTDCCLHNMWAPLQQFTMMLKPDAIIRGQRLSEKYKSTLRDGDVMGGVRYEFPIQEWSEQDVFNFLNRSGIEIPDYYRFTQTSLDCWTCTAYLDAKQGQLQYMKQFHPDKHAVVMERLHRIAAITEGQTAHLRQAISHGH